WYATRAKQTKRHAAYLQSSVDWKEAVEIKDARERMSECTSGTRRERSRRRDMQLICNRQLIGKKL
ncbi:hypothetical protein, partial [Alkalicoccus luteus]|uniref:hypothetical protein n=1 Tax=Alkalicoccus luteus TaxID=1237094 RepID=UPI00197B6CB1